MVDLQRSPQNATERSCGLMELDFGEESFCGFLGNLLL
jgi:hypothetical protein